MSGFKTMNICFLFHVLYSYCYVWNLITFFSNNLGWSRLVASSYSPLLMIIVEKTLEGNELTP